MIILSLLLSLSLNAHATLPKPLIFGGSGECDLSCAEAAVKIEKDATSGAVLACYPLTAKQITDWAIEVHGYGRLYVWAVFTCLEKN